ncbi:MAG TPA: hypothetical protein VM911_03485 [Pyrinomonadaceae bacterium]|jgi:hypothetical protein|nr:hypothetical protein [Pyrinomonadaceae bacterium]
MRRLKTLAAIIMLAMVMSLSTPQAFAGFMSTGVAASDGTAESPGYTDGSAESPGIAGDMQTPSASGEMSTPGFSDGWIGTGLAALVSLFG